MTYLSYMHVQKLMSSLHVGRCLFFCLFQVEGRPFIQCFSRYNHCSLFSFLFSPSFVITRLRQSFLECKYIRRKECPWYMPSQFFSLTLVQYQLRYQRCNTLHTLIAQVSNRQFSVHFRLFKITSSEVQVLQPKGVPQVHAIHCLSLDTRYQLCARVTTHSDFR